MYEIVCNSSSDRKTWVNSLRTALENCPEDGKTVNDLFEFNITKLLETFCET